MHRMIDSKVGNSVHRMTAWLVDLANRFEDAAFAAAVGPAAPTMAAPQSELNDAQNHRQIGAR
jgi:hypothetical protein